MDIIISYLQYSERVLLKSGTYSILWLLKYDPIDKDFRQLISLIQSMISNLFLQINFINFSIPKNVFINIIIEIYS